MPLYCLVTLHRMVSSPGQTSFIPTLLISHKLLLYLAYTLLGRSGLCQTTQVHQGHKVLRNRHVTFALTRLIGVEAPFLATWWFSRSTFVHSAIGWRGSPIFGALSVFSFEYSPGPSIRCTGRRRFVSRSLREQGWRSGESARLPPMWPGFKPRCRYVGWVCCWFSPLLREVFLRVLRFSPLPKNQHFQIPIRSGTHGHWKTSS